MTNHDRKWLFVAEGANEPTVTVYMDDPLRPDDRRRLVGHLTLPPYQWTLLKEVLMHGTAKVSEREAQSIRLEIKDHRHLRQWGDD